MNVSDETKPSKSDETMFGCECALPFLTGLQGSAARKGAASVAALGAMPVAALGALMALAACDGAPQDASRPEAADRVSAAFDKIERQIERAKVRLKNGQPQDSSAAAASGPQAR